MTQELANYFKRAPKIMDQKAVYAVLAPLIRTSRGWELIFEERAIHIRQGGEVSFPGGRVEEGETPMAGAIRESCEELGILPENIDIWGPLDILVNFEGMVLHPFIGEIIDRPLASLVPNPDEVSRIFTVPLAYFMENPPDIYRLPITLQTTDDFPYELIPGGKNYPWRRGVNRVHFYQPREAIIWGLTAKITEHIVAIIKANQA